MAIFFCLWHHRTLVNHQLLCPHGSYIIMYINMYHVYIVHVYLAIAPEKQIQFKSVKNRLVMRKINQIHLTKEALMIMGGDRSS